MFASPGYLDRHGTPKAPQALAAHDCVTFSALGGGETWNFRDEAVRVRSRMYVTTAEAALEAAVCGVGITRLLSYQAVEAVRAGGIVTILRRHEPAPLPVSLVYVRERRVTGKLRAFLDFAARRLRERLQAAGS